MSEEDQFAIPIKKEDIKFEPKLKKYMDLIEEKTKDYPDVNLDWIELSVLANILIEERKKTAKKIFKKIDNLISKINKYKSDIDGLVAIGRQNALNDLDNELIKIKKEFGVKE